MKPPELVMDGWGSSKYSHRIWIDYKLTIADWENLWAKQDGCCAICRTVFAHPVKKSLTHSGVKCFVDHKHKPGELKGQCSRESVRGLLCFNCNSHLGTIREDRAFLKGALVYLEEQGVSEFDYEQPPSKRDVEVGLSLAEQAAIYGFDPRLEG